ncbi:MAG: methionyl-tRNA formyltransferase [Omnitrophica bacterium RIFCSPHIGHO2_02_FULL_51_18]|nr:MAG: methionyl-tRNA formyltransferase [Omnitrophica bacterium RIFCSPHIGHO2_02_FULL_51_18]
MRLIFFGTSAFGIASLEALKGSAHSTELLVTTSDKSQGRNLKPRPSPVKHWAHNNQFPCLEASEIRSKEFLEKVRRVQADLFVVVSFGLILPRALLELPKRMTLNVHPSLLPRYRGAAPMHWAIINGDTQTGVTVMRMVERLDAGDVVLQKKADILPGDDIFSLEERLGRLGSQTLLEAVGQVERDGATFVPQEESCASYARKLTKEDGRIDWKRKAREIRDRVRAMKEWPTSYTFYGGKRLIIDGVGISGSEVPRGRAPGVILDASQEKGIWVATADFPVEIKTLKLEGRNLLSAGDFLNGFPLQTGQLFE